MTTTNAPHVQHQQQGGTCCQEAHDEVARAAFGIYEKSGSQAGHCERNWLAAEAQVAATHAAAGRVHAVAGRPVAASVR